ncbi:hypothetical protein [Moraxella sp. Pampa]|uniref:hypothetical protein n=1 Tax=Moraxella sp. Pampa TaxID=3111978 RepID=UPI002B400B6D|nr:hypothetical protein [Moraxella sp. Pampa]
MLSTLTVDTTHTQHITHSHRPPTSQTNPVGYLHQLFSCGNNAIRRRQIAVRSDRLINEISARYGYRKVVDKTACYVKIRS